MTQGHTVSKQGLIQDLNSPLQLSLGQLPAASQVKLSAYRDQLGVGGKNKGFRVGGNRGKGEVEVRRESPSLTRAETHGQSPGDEAKE